MLGMDFVSFIILLVISIAVCAIRRVCAGNPLALGLGGTTPW